MMRVATLVAALAGACTSTLAQPVFVLDGNGAFGRTDALQENGLEIVAPTRPSRSLEAPDDVRGMREIEVPVPSQRQVEATSPVTDQVEGERFGRTVSVPLPPPPPPVPLPPANAIEPGTVFHIGGTHFATGRHDLNATAWAGLRTIAAALALTPNRTIQIQGHTDDRGDRAMNQALSEGRASSVADALVSLGIARSRMVVEGFGEDRPERSNTTASGMAHNRRVDVIFE